VLIKSFRWVRRQTAEKRKKKGEAGLVCVQTSKGDCEEDFIQSRLNQCIKYNMASTLTKVCWSGETNYSRVRTDREPDRQVEL